MHGMLETLILEEDKDDIIAEEDNTKECDGAIDPVFLRRTKMISI